MMRLIIPSLLILVSVRERASGTDGQNIVDEANVAAMWKWRALIVIADHAYQGFDRLEKARPGMKAWFNGVKYVCDRTEVGFIRDKRLYTSDGAYVHETFLTGLCIYTCHGRKLGDVQPVRLTHWRIG